MCILFGEFSHQNFIYSVWLCCCGRSFLQQCEMIWWKTTRMEGLWFPLRSKWNSKCSLYANQKDVLISKWILNFLDFHIKTEFSFKKISILRIRQFHHSVKIQLIANWPKDMLDLLENIISTGWSVKKNWTLLLSGEGRKGN